MPRISINIYRTAAITDIQSPIEKNYTKINVFLKKKLGNIFKVSFNHTYSRQKNAAVND